MKGCIDSMPGNQEIMPNSLPFNTTIITSLFTPLSSEQEPKSDVPGFWTILQGASLVVAVDSSEQVLLVGDLPASLEPETEPLMIGLWQGKPLRCARIALDAALPEGYETLPFQGPDMRLDNTLATIAGRAAQIMHWERRSRHCSHCGSMMSRIPASWGKHCQSCGDDHFPHIHPCIIVLVRRGEDMLLIRNAAWNPGRFSLVAGFVDFGESLEECVQREVREEAGIEVTNIRYVASQCWPFPSQVMIGFLADYAGGEVTPDGVEVVEAHWFHEGVLPLSPGGKRSIARWILDTFGKNQATST
ncbi:MAG: NAD(+) diphosphatase [Desulfuromonadaceae bacterium]|nr:NAD(+) diphosphatase [Desulfuromonadaceae bacterium]MDD5107016.1 NAD(+) diphosphatase [Desulfuromonadaceae bacterium]